MGGFAVAFGQLDDHAWTRIVADLSLSPSETTREWKDDARSIRIARVSRTNSDAIVERNGSIVVAQGDVAEARIASAHALSGDDSVAKFTGDFVFALYDVARRR